MAKKFHTKAFESKTVEELSRFLGCNFKGENSTKLQDFAPLESAVSSDICIFHNDKYKEALQKTLAGAVILSQKFEELLPEGVCGIFSDNPHEAYAQALSWFYPEAAMGFAVEASTTNIHPEASVASSAVVAPTAVVEAQAQVGEECQIAPHAYIGKGVVLGKGCRIGAGAKIMCAELGEGCIIHPGAVIGKCGFGFAPGKAGILKVPQIGSVKIGNHVEIGANTTVDRGSLRDTIIGDGTKIDNLVQIAHNVEVGKCCMIVAGVGIAGSTKLGNGVVVGGQAGFVGHIEVADGVQVSARSGVTKSISEKGITVAGFPAVPVREWRKQQAAAARLTKKKS